MPTTQPKTDQAARSRGRPKLEDVAAIESRLLAVAFAEFTTHGYGGTSMARIVKAAGVSKTTLYSRFPSKADLFRAIIHKQIQRLAASATLQPDTGRPELVDGLMSYANRALEFSLEGEMLEVNRLIYGEALRFPELAAAALEATELGIVQIADFIRQCAEADDLPCKDPRGVAEAFIFLLRGWYAHLMLIGENVSRTRRERWVEGTVRTLVSARADW